MIWLVLATAIYNPTFSVYKKKNNKKVVIYKLYIYIRPLSNNFVY